MAFCGARSDMSYKSIHHLFAAHRIFRVDTASWRLTPPILGEINALPQSHGLIVATNGIDCMIETTPTAKWGSIFEGHLDNFVPYRPVDQHVIDEFKAKDPTSNHKSKVVMDLTDLLI